MESANSWVVPVAGGRSSSLSFSDESLSDVKKKTGKFTVDAMTASSVAQLLGTDWSWGKVYIMEYTYKSTGEDAAVPERLVHQVSLDSYHLLVRRPR